MATKREDKRLARLFKDRQIIADLRKHFEGYEPANGFSLTPDKIADMPYSQKRAMRAKHKKLQALLTAPFVDFVKPADDIADQALRRFTGERMRGMKHYIVRKHAANAKVSVVDGNVQITTKEPDEYVHKVRYFMFPQVARNRSHMLKMFDKMYPDMPPGYYRMQTEKYDDTGGVVVRERLREFLVQQLERYDNPKYDDGRFLYQVAGFRWTQNSHKGAAIEKGKQDQAREKQRELNRQKRDEVRREVSAAKKKAKRKKK